jgi:hypothetical protein
MVTLERIDEGSALVRRRDLCPPKQGEKRVVAATAYA